MKTGHQKNVKQKLIERKQSQNENIYNQHQVGPQSLYGN